MSKSGEIVPELAGFLRAIAARIEDGTATSGDAETLRKIAAQAAGDDAGFVLKMHRTGRGQPARGSAGVDRRLAMAQAIAAYRAAHPASVNETCAELASQFQVGPESLRKAWQEMAPLLEMDAEKRETLLFFKRLEARGLATITREPMG